MVSKYKYQAAKEKAVSQPKENPNAAIFRNQDRQELVALRMQVQRLAIALGVSKNIGLTELLSKAQSSGGWNELIEEMMSCSWANDVKANAVAEAEEDFIDFSNTHKTLNGQEALNF